MGRLLEFGTGRSAWFGSIGLVIVALLLGLLLQKVHVTNVALVFLTAVLASGAIYGLRPSLLACVLSALAYNFFFLPPVHTFNVADPENVVALFFFLVTAVVASNLAARVRAQATAARERAAMTQNLYLFSRKLAGVVTLDDLLWVAAHQFAQMLEMRVVILLPAGQSVEVRAGYPPEDLLDDADLAAAKWVWQQGSPAGRGTETLPRAGRLFLPMRTGRGMIGVVGLDSDKSGPLLTPDQVRLFDALADQAALAIERVNLAADMDRIRLAAESERLRAALLTSISHDLRTPLASILGSASSLKKQRRALSEAAQDELVDTIQEESERLNRFIANLLDMTKLEAGAIAPNMEEAELSDVVGSALRRAGKVLSRHDVEIELAPDLPTLRFDAVLLEQVLFNVLDNAAKYSPEGSKVRVAASLAEGRVRLEIADEGDGISSADLERIFDKFYRVRAADSKRAGTGLGLPICRGFIEAMGGTITASNRDDRHGAIFTITLPVPVARVRESAA